MSSNNSNGDRTNDTSNDELVARLMAEGHDAHGFDDFHDGHLDFETLSAMARQHTSHGGHSTPSSGATPVTSSGGQRSGSSNSSSSSSSAPSVLSEAIVQEEGKCNLHDGCTDISALLRVRNGDIIHSSRLLADLAPGLQSAGIIRALDAPNAHTELQKAMIVHLVGEGVTLSAGDRARLEQLFQRSIWGANRYMAIDGLAQRLSRERGGTVASYMATATRMIDEEDRQRAAARASNGSGTSRPPLQRSSSTAGGSAASLSSNNRGSSAAATTGWRAEDSVLAAAFRDALAASLRDSNGGGGAGTTAAATDDDMIVYEMKPDESDQTRSMTCVRALGGAPWPYHRYQTFNERIKGEEALAAATPSSSSSSSSSSSAPVTAA